MKSPINILIILTGSLGDLSRALVIPTTIKQYWPNSNITWLVDSTWHDFIRLHADIDQFIVFDRKQPVSSFIETCILLRTKSFDYCLDLQRILKSGVFSFFSGAKARIGFHKKNCKEFNFIFNNQFIKACDEKLVPKLDQYLDFLDVLGINRPNQLNFGLLENARTIDLSHLLPETRTGQIGIVLSSSWLSKNWTADGYMNLIKILLDKQSHSLLLLGGKKDQQLANDLLRASNASTRLVDLAGKTSLAELTAIISRCQLLIGPDSGPGHIAAALGVPVVSIFGPTIPVRVAPYNNLDLVVKIDVPCGPCLKKVCPGYGNICTHNIKAEAVATVVMQQIS